MINVMQNGETGTVMQIEKALINDRLYVSFSRVAKYMDINKRRILMKSYIFSQFYCCPLVWMCHSKNLLTKLTAYRREHHELCIETVSQQYFAIEICKVKMSISPKIMNKIFRLSKNSVYSRRNCI